MATVDQANICRQSMDGKNMYTNSNLLHISFSERNKLQIGQQTEKARDFTKLFGNNLNDEKNESKKSKSKVKVFNDPVS